MCGLYRLDLLAARDSLAETNDTKSVLLTIFRDAGSMLVHAYNGRIDHLHGRIVSRRQAIHDPIPDPCLSPANEAIVASGMRSVVLWQITPWRT